MRISGKLYPLAKFQAAAVNSWEPHAHIRESKNQAAFLIFYLDPEWLQIQGLFVKGQAKFGTTSFSVSNQLWRLIWTFSRRLLDEIPTIDVQAYVHRAVDSVINAMEHKEQDFIGFRDFETDTDIGIQKSLDFMRENIGSRVSADDLARAAGLSRPYLFALFRKQLNITPGVFWNTLRVEAAMNHLDQDNVNLIEIADMLGFTEPGNFSRFFRNITGFYPSIYRDASYTVPTELKSR